MELAEVDNEPAPLEDVLDPELEIVDAHHHLWAPGYWIPYDIEAMRADLTRGHRVVSTVFVECMKTFRPEAASDDPLLPVGETEVVLRESSVSISPASISPASISPASPMPGVPTTVAAAIVGWADLRRPDVAAQTLDAHLEVGQGRFRGVRFNVVWDERHPGHAQPPVPRHLLLDGDFRTGLREVARRGLTYDVWLFHPQLPELAETLDEVPELTFVLNHLGGPVPDDASPPSRMAMFDHWRTMLCDVARRPNVVLKIGGVGMPVYGFGFGGPTRPSSEELAAAWRPYVEAAVEAFGADRCMFESNFPVDKQQFSYDSLWNAFKRITTGWSADERRMLFSGTARRVYRLDG